MKLLSSLKQKKRYLVFEVISKNKYSTQEIEKEVNLVLTSWLGQLGIARAAPLFLKEKFNQSKQRFILKVNHKYVAEAKAALSLIKKINNNNNNNNNKVIVKSLITAGTIKKAKVVLDK